MAMLKTWLRSRSLHSDDIVKRVQTMRNLTAAEAVENLMELVDALSDPEALVRTAAASALKLAGKDEAVEPLIGLVLNERQHEPLAASIEALGSISPQQAMDYLLPALNHSDSVVRQNAATALHDACWEQLSNAEKVRVAIVRSDWEEVLPLGAAAVGPLVSTFRSGSPHIRREAAEALANMDCPEAGAALVTLLADVKLDFGGREIAAWALRKFRADDVPQDVWAYIYVVEGHWEEIPSFGALAVDPLRIAVRDERREVRQKAAIALSRIQAPQAAGALARIMCDDRHDVAVRQTAAAALGQIGDDSFIPPLVEALHDAAWDVRDAAAASLELLGWIPAGDHEKVLRAIARREWQVVAAMGEAALEPLADVLQYASVGSSAAHVLVNMGEPGVQALIGALRRPNQPMSVKELVAAKLAEIGDPRAIEPIEQMLLEPDMAVRQVAVWTLERLGWRPTTDMHRVIVAIAHENWEELPALGAAAIEPLLTLAADDMAREQAVAALSNVLMVSVHRLPLKQLEAVAHFDVRRWRAQHGSGPVDAASRVEAETAGEVGETGSATAGVAAEGAGAAKSETGDFEAARKLARQELKRRGVMV